MEKFASFLERKIMPVAAKISNQRHMRAVRADNSNITTNNSRVIFHNIIKHTY